MRFLLLFFADEAAWMALPETERDAAVERIGAWFGALAQSGTIVEGHRLTGGRNDLTRAARTRGAQRQSRSSPTGRSSRRRRLSVVMPSSRRWITRLPSPSRRAGPPAASWRCERWPSRRQHRWSAQHICEWNHRRRNYGRNQSAPMSVTFLYWLMAVTISVYDAPNSRPGMRMRGRGP